MLKEQLSRNISRYRKEKGWTQEELASQIGLSFQAISKWENAQTLPDTALLPALSSALGISIDKLLGYGLQDQPRTIYEDAYKTEDYYWGTKPNELCYRVLELLPPTEHLRLVDLGSGEGKDAVFFARNGYDVTAVDISDAGLDKTKRLAEQARVHIRTIKADILDFRLDEKVDILFSSGVLHYIPPQLRDELFEHYKRFTNDHGLHAFNVFVQKPFIAEPPEYEPNAHKWLSGELLMHYHDWLLEHSSEVVFDCNSSGIPHQHAMTLMIAQKINA